MMIAAKVRTHDVAKFVQGSLAILLVPSMSILRTYGMAHSCHQAIDCVTRLIGLAGRVLAYSVPHANTVLLILASRIAIHTYHDLRRVVR